MSRGIDILAACDAGPNGTMKPTPAEYSQLFAFSALPCIFTHLYSTPETLNLGCSASHVGPGFAPSVRCPSAEALAPSQY